MPEISYKEFDAHLKQMEKSTVGHQPQVYLFYGEELLYKKAYTSLIEFLIAPEERAMNCEPVDGAPESIRDAVNRASTYSMLAGNKVVTVQESRIFYGNQEKNRMLEKAKEAFQREDMNKAAKYILNLLGQHSMGTDEIRTPEDLRQISDEDGGEPDVRWLLNVVEYCRENGLTAASSGRPEQFLESAILKGFPAGNYLAITTDLVDKRKTLFKCIREKGMTVDCSVPKGDRRADRQIQETVLRSRAEAILDGSTKTLSPPAFARLHEMTGFDLRTFSNNLEKLVLYVGDRNVIGVEDVTDVLERSKQDPIYELTGAISERNPVLSLKILDSLLQSGLHHLQVFAAIVNQTRKLLLFKAFVRSPQGSVWQSGMPYGAFSARVLPAMQDYDQELVQLMSRWEERLHPDAQENESEDTKRAKTKKVKKTNLKIPADLMVAANPKNPYPIYLTLKNTDRFRLEELENIHIQLGKADMKLKRSARNPRLVLEEVILKICGAHA